jgi:hypothetical protein
VEYDMSHNFRLDHRNGTAVTAPARVAPRIRGKGFRIRIKNLDALNDLEISFNSGEMFYPISPGDELAEDANFHFFFVRAVLQGGTPLANAALATAAALPAYTQAGAGVGATLTAVANGVLTVDGVATVLGDRILVKDGAAGADNGLYTVTTEGTAGAAYVLTRATDHDANAEVISTDFVFIVGGTANANLTFQITTTGAITVDTTDVVWAELDAEYRALVAVG